MDLDGIHEFSIIVPVYNVEEYLEEAIQSIITQTFSFDKVEIILIDDGSIDASPSICDTYSREYPNIKTFHIKNSGVSAARNIGLSKARGRIIGFLDSDDTFSPNVLEKVYAFYKMYPEIDVVSIPRKIFGKTSGDHILNYKFDKGTRVIDLTKEYWMLQNSVTFFTHKSINEMRFDSDLKYSEDTKFVLEVLAKNPLLGAVSDCAYNYRKRMDSNTSAVDLAQGRNIWYLPTLTHFSKYLIENYSDSSDILPPFLAYAIVYELSWKITVQHVDEDVIPLKELIIYKQEISKILKKIPSKIIVEQKSIFIEHKLRLLELKYNRKPNYYYKNKDIIFHYGDYNFFRYSRNLLTLESLEIHRDYVILDCKFISSPPLKNYNFIAINNDKKYSAEIIEMGFNKYSLNDLIRSGCRFRFKILLGKTNHIYIESLFENKEVILTNIKCGKVFPIRQESNKLHYYSNGWDVSLANNLLIIKKAYLDKQLIKQELKSFSSTPIATLDKIRLFTKRWFSLFIQKCNKKEIWLISDRINKAGDNGEAFCRYMHHQTTSIKPYYVIDKHSYDYKRLKKEFQIVPCGSLKHKVLSLIATYVISSQADYHMMNPFNCDKSYLNLHSKFIFLQHGVTKDDVSSYLDKYDKNIHGLITTGLMEYQSFLNYPYHYESKNIWNVGFSRFDYLKDDKKKKITIMPTWRAYLVSSMKNTGERTLVDNYDESTFYKEYCKLLNDKNLFDSCESFGYAIQIMFHPNMKKFIDIFPHDPRLTILPFDTQYSTIFSESSLIISDYSSTVFDFAYMGKPIIYYQPDYDEFFSGIHSYKKGYFSYSDDGFGEVEYDMVGLVKRIIEYVQNDCQLKEIFKSRIKKFFTHVDLNNNNRLLYRIQNQKTIWEPIDKANAYLSRNDEEHAISILKKAIESDNPEAYTLLSKIYQDRKYSLDETIQLSKKAVQLGSLDAQNALIDQLTKSPGRSNDLLQYLQKFSLKGNSFAQLVLGKMYYNGEHVTKDIGKAVELFKMSAQQNVNESKQLLFRALFEENSSESKHELFDVASIFAKYDDIEAINWLIKCYREGIGTEKDIYLASKWAHRGLALNYSKFNNILIDILWEISSTESYEEMFILASDSAGKGDSGSMGRLAKMYQFGVGVDKDLKKSVEWYRKASQKSDWWTKDLLNVLFEIKEKSYYIEIYDILDRKLNDGDYRIVEKYAPLLIKENGFDKKRVCSILKTAYEMGSKAVLTFYIDSLFAINSNSSNKEAFDLALSTSDENSGSMGRLGRAYRDGLGVRKNTKKAIECFEKASKVSPWWNEELQKLL